MRFHVHRGVAVDRIHDRRQKEARGVAAGKSAVAVRRPLHGCPHAVAVAEVDVVAHPDLVAVIDDRRARKRHQQRVHQLDLAAVIVHQRCQPPPDSEIEPCPRIGGVGRPQVIALDIGHHFQGELIVIAQEQRPLAIRRDVRRLPQDVGDREAVLLGDGHVNSRHQREMIGHVAFVALAEIGGHVLGPLIGFRQQELAGRVGIELRADLLDDGVGFREILVVGALPLAKIGDRVQPKTVDADIEPAPHDEIQRPQDARVVVVEIRLVREEPVPVIGAGDRIPGPVRLLGVAEDDPRACIFVIVVAPHIPVARVGAGLAAAGALKPGMLIGGVVDHQLDDDPSGLMSR